MTTRLDTQREQVRAALVEGKALTPLDAERYFGCRRLGARIYELRREGMDIAMNLVRVPTRDGGVAHVAQYRLVGKGA